MTRRRQLLIAAALVVALGAGYPSAAIGHRLDHGSSWWHGVDAESRTEGPTTELRFAFNPGGQITFGASIRNPGPWPVTITGMELPVFVTIRIPDVEQAPGAGLLFDDLAVDYDVLGLPRHQRVPMGSRLLVHSSEGYVPAEGRTRPGS